MRGERQDADGPDAAGAYAVDAASGETGVREGAARALGLQLVGGLVGCETRRVLVHAGDRHPSPHAHAACPARSASSRWTASLCASGAWCPACASTSSLAPAMPRASSSDCAGGTI